MPMATALRRAFGTPSTDTTTVISARDANERAAQLGPQDAHLALDLLHGADVNGDDILAAALGFRAYELSGVPGTDWPQVLDAYLERRPDAVVALAELSPQPQETR